VEDRRGAAVGVVADDFPEVTAWPFA
jgi:hypothetical protein